MARKGKGPGRKAASSAGFGGARPAPRGGFGKADAASKARRNLARNKRGAGSGRGAVALVAGIVGLLLLAALTTVLVAWQSHQPDNPRVAALPEPMKPAKPRPRSEPVGPPPPAFMETLPETYRHGNDAPAPVQATKQAPLPPAARPAPTPKPAVAVQLPAPAATPEPAKQPVQVVVAKPASPPGPTPVSRPRPRVDTPVVPSASGGRVVIVMDDLGIDRARSDRTVALPGPLTLAYLPYGKDLDAQTTDARAAGHELMLHMPMEPMGRGGDPGPGALRVGMDPATIRLNLSNALDAFDGAVGVNNHMGSRFTSDPAGMAVVMQVLSERGLFWLDSRTASESVGLELARGHGLRHAARDIFLDHYPDVESVRRQLERVEHLARRDGLAIAIGHPRDPTLTALGLWLEQLPAKGLRLVPLSTVVKPGDPRLLAARRNGESLQP